MTKSCGQVNARERGLFTGIPIFGAIGAGKTSGCMYPYAEQLIAYKSRAPEHRVGGLVFEVKGDFCRKVRTILESHDRANDYVEVNLDADYRYNPPYNDMDAYALAYNIASLLNNLFGKGKERFWQQAYTNLVKFIIQLHKVAYDYVTLFDVYECAINHGGRAGVVRLREFCFQQGPDSTSAPVKRRLAEIHASRILKLDRTAKQDEPAPEGEPADFPVEEPAA